MRWRDAGEEFGHCKNRLGKGRNLMGWKQFFTRSEDMNAEEARAFIAKNKEGTYTLLDVRQPGEYEKERIPGGLLIPLPQLPDRLDELDRDKPIITY